MADTPKPAAGAKSAGGDAQSIMTRKVGPFPVWIWAVAAVGLYYWYTHYGPGKSSPSSSSAQAVDPNTGVPYAEELANAQQAPATIIDVPEGPAGPAGPAGAPGPPGRAGTPGSPGGPITRPPTVPPRKPPAPKPVRRITVPNIPAPLPKRGGRPPVRVTKGTGSGPPVRGGELAAPGQVQTSISPVYDQWTAGGDSVPEPQPAYAPMTAGSIYG